MRRASGSILGSRALVPGALTLGALFGGCGSTVASQPGIAVKPEPRTAAALLRIATQFNAEYAANRDALVYSRWDARSRAVIGERVFARRHAECDTAPGTATVERAAPAADGFWTVEYSLSGIQFTDYWRYTGGRWVFDLVRSNPSAVALYRLSFAAYARAVGCAAAR